MMPNLQFTQIELMEAFGYCLKNLKRLEYFTDYIGVAGGSGFYLNPLPLPAIQA